MNQRRKYNLAIKEVNTNSISKGLIIVFCLTVFILVAFYFNYSNVSADNSSNRVKQARSIEVEEGDTLWGIANEYITEEYNDINEYIEELKRSNGLYDDIIHAGCYLIVPYYEPVDK